MKLLGIYFYCTWRFVLSLWDSSDTICIFSLTQASSSSALLLNCWKRLASSSFSRLFRAASLNPSYFDSTWSLRARTSLALCKRRGSCCPPMVEVDSRWSAIFLYRYAIIFCTVRGCVTPPDVRASVIILWACALHVVVAMLTSPTHKRERAWYHPY